ncbi:SWF or SNF family helicase [Streptomyces sp. NPDC089799]|uniref:SWIM zinc finger family protein n=1 Tax=Streptomyces sp. NPDC089799 TaxID=3155066 RepID=UPI003437F952
MTAHEKVFPALPAASGRGFARTWWGHAWLRSLEDSALDGEQLKQGRRYARSGAVGAVSVRPGRLTAVVRDGGGTAHRTDVLVQEFGGADWNRLLDVAAAESGHIAALLDREMPPELVEDAAAAGVDLLPGIGDLDPSCDCGEWDHCGHTAALCYQVARLLDQDPFVLLLLRGLAEPEVLAQLEKRSAAGPAAHGTPDGAADGAADGTAGGTTDRAADGRSGDTVAAEAVFAAGRVVAPLPALPALPDGPGQPPALDTGSEPDPELLDVTGVELLAQAAAGEAYRLLAEALTAAGPSGTGAGPDSALSPAQDAVRLAAGTREARVRARLARASGRDRADLDLAVRAWSLGGAPALAALEEDWTPDRRTLARAAASLAAAEAPAGLHRVRARWTLPGGEEQLRLGREGRWWPYRREDGRWVPAGPAGPDPSSALAASAGWSGGPHTG